MPIEYATESENIIMQIFGSEKERIISFIPKEDNYNLELHIFKSLEKLEEIHKHEERAKEFFVEIAKEFIVKSLDKYLKGDLNNDQFFTIKTFHNYNITLFSFSNQFRNIYKVLIVYNNW